MDRSYKVWSMSRDYLIDLLGTSSTHLPKVFQKNNQYSPTLNIGNYDATYQNILFWIEWYWYWFILSSSQWKTICYWFSLYPVFTLIILTNENLMLNQKIEKTNILHWLSLKKFCKIINYEYWKKLNFDHFWREKLLTSTYYTLGAWTI